MRGRLITKFLLLVLGVLFLLFVWKSLPIISGYSAKVVASGVFVAGRPVKEVIRQDLVGFPTKWSSCTVDGKDSSVTASVWGLAKRKAIYRRGLGATLVSGCSEEEIREQKAGVAVRPGGDMDTVDWPTGDRGCEGDGVDTAKMNAAVSLAYGGSGTRAVVVVYHGKIVGERYAPGFDRHTRLAGWSMAKGVTSAMVGILVGQHRLDVGGPAPVEEWRKDDRRRITVEDLLHMKSGLSWWELYAGPADATRMLFEEADMGKFAERSALRHLPGGVFNYSSGTANILSSIIRSKTGIGYYRWPYEQLFYKIGMYSAVLEPDAGGTFVGSSYCYATARDWARFGLLYLRDGVWGGQRVLPAGWVSYTRKGDGYGAMWWLNTGGRRFPGVPEDCYSCEGYEGQYVWVIPSRDLVVVRLAMEHGARLNGGAFLRGIIGACNP
ncbi:MAG: serine hydrolase [Bacteroidetes bacterium]|nr:serine hydrolase [Bacteroidota bacterium]